MNTKILLIAFSAVAISSCSTAYKSGQTPDDVYYSPVRVVDESRNDDRREDTRNYQESVDEARMRLEIRDRRFRDLNYDYGYDYSYRYSPYSYAYNNFGYYNGFYSNNFGYYYNPFYCPMPLYNTKTSSSVAINTTPRTVNLKAYNNYNSVVNSAKGSSTNGVNWVKPGRQYNNSNDGSRVGNVIRQVFTPNSSNNNTNNNSSNNNSRTYTPSTPSSSSSSSSSSGSSSSGGSSGGSVSRPGRGG